ncbi:hypothetical protein A9Q83_09620 [Alphaproteobacteria bacterium 46_93_T64]|nr:hypothetical protein A9Q83_09620 [Alphaproteobacteria bacterium 46_93_T64]
MALGKQAKVLTDKQCRIVLRHLEESRYPVRDKVMFLLSIKAGLRAKEIASITWAMVTDANGNVSDHIALPNTASKGKGGGRTIPLNSDLKSALIDHQSRLGDKAVPQAHIIHSEREKIKGMAVGSITVWFHRLYAGMGFDGCSSHSGRRTFITKAAHKITEAGGSLRDIQQLAGHSDLSTTQRYIEGSSQAKVKVVDLI